MSVYTKNQLKKFKDLVAPFVASELAELLGEALGPEELTELLSEIVKLVSYLNNRELYEEYTTELARVKRLVNEEAKT